MDHLPPIAPAPAGPLAAVLVYDGLCTFEFAIAAEIFALPRPEMGEGWYRYAPCPVTDRAMRALGGIEVHAPGAAEGALDEADLIIIPGWNRQAAPEALMTRLRAAHARGARLASICSGAFLLAEAGLLDGRRAATHWRYAAELQAGWPDIHVDANALYVEDDGVYTSAGSAAGLDLLLHIIRQDFGPDAANSVARRLVIAAHRNGGQAQFIERPVTPRPAGRLAPLMDAMRQTPHEDWSVTRMARMAAMSERSFMRHFRQAAGETPARWLSTLRLTLACELLETTTLPMEDIAARSGFGSALVLRRHMRRLGGLSPREHRQRFSRLPAQGQAGA